MTTSHRILNRPVHSSWLQGVCVLFLCALALAAALISPAPAGAVQRTALVNQAVESGERVWTAAQDPDQHNPGASEFFTYALALCEAKARPERLERLFEVAARMQDRDPQSPSYGSFRWNWADKTVTDANAIEFCMKPGAIVWLRHRDTLPAAARQKLREILGPAIEASLRHRVSDGYTNIALMSAGNLILLGEGLGHEDVADEGYNRLQAVFELTAKSGIREYVSPTYYAVDLDALQLTEAFCRRPAGQRQARALVELFWTDIAANFWWANRRLCGAHSRDYDYLHSQGGLDRHLRAAGFLDGKPEGDVSAVFSTLARWQPSADLIAMSKTKLPRLVRQTWGGFSYAAVTSTVPPSGPAPAEWGGASPVAVTSSAGAPSVTQTTSGSQWASFTHWLAKDVTLSIASANYGPIDVPLTVDFPGSRDGVRCYFIPDGRNDPYGKSKIPWRGHAKAVHLQPFFTGVQETQDALAMVVYRDKDVPADSKTLESHFVMPREVDAIFFGERKVDFAAGVPRSIPLAAGDAVFLRQGTAALAVRVPWARTRAAEDAPVALVWDDNPWGAIRLTVDHRQTDQPPKTSAAAVFQVRVGSGLNEGAFADFRRAFAAAKCEVSIEPDKISLQSPAADKTLSIAAAAPWSKPSRLEPAPPHAILEIDGQDVGRKLLDAGSGDSVLVTVECGKVVNTMRGGMGASWHAMEAPIPYGVKHPAFSSYSHGGSGWGGYPPAEDERSWQQIYRHANWLGLDWNRVEIEQRVYEPQRDKFTFDSPEMRILYRILDWNQKNQVDVFFQQMWCNTAWLAYPEFRDDPVGRVHSAPADLDAFADGLAALVEHLIKDRGYTCIKWLSISNEPGGFWTR